MISHDVIVFPGKPQSGISVKTVRGFTGLKMANQEVTVDTCGLVPDTGGGHMTMHYHTCLSGVSSSSPGLINQT